MSEWPQVALGEVAEIRRNAVQPEDIKSGTMYVGLENIESGGRLNDVRPVTEGELASAKFTFGSEDILYGKLRPYLAKISAPNFSGICSTDILPIRVSNKIERRYLLHYLRQSRMVDLANARSSGANLPRLNPSELAKFSVPIPPLDEQRRIASILDHADTLRAKRRGAIPRLDELTHSIFVDMFGSLHANEGGWPTVEFGSLMRSGPQNGLYKPASDYGSGTRILRIDGYHNNVPIVEESLKRVRLTEAEIDKYSLSENDVVVNRVNSIEHLGKSTLVPSLAERVVFESNMMRIKLDESRIIPEFCISQLQSTFVRGQILGAAKDAVNQSSVNQTDIRSLCFRLPPISSQRIYAKRVRNIAGSRKKLQAALVQLDELFDSLQSRAFRGEF